MSPRYTVKVVIDFAAAHILHGYPGPCSQLHGHNWKIETEVVATELDNVGMGVDFKVVKQAIRDVTDPLDHQFLNQLPPFDTINPTAENLAQYLYRELAKHLTMPNVKVHAVTVWETERACVRYTEE